jgi:hypothetical protein
MLFKPIRTHIFVLPEFSRMSQDGSAHASVPDVEFKIDTHILGVEPTGPVMILYLRKAGPEAVDVTWQSA